MLKKLVGGNAQPRVGRWLSAGGRPNENLSSVAVEKSLGSKLTGL